MNSDRKTQRLGVASGLLFGIASGVGFGAAVGTAFDNVTLLRQVGEEDGITRWTVHRTFPFGVFGGDGATPPP